MMNVQEVVYGCNYCIWQGTEDDLHYLPPAFGVGIGLPVCPECGSAVEMLPVCPPPVFAAEPDLGEPCRVDN